MNNYIKTIHFLLAFGTCIICSCKYDVNELQSKPVASFTVTPVAGQTNKYALASTTQGAFKYQWDKANGTGYTWGKAMDTIYFPDQGSYTVKLIAYGQGGFDTSSKIIVVANNDPAAQTPLKIITGNSSKKWKLAPEAGALWIGTSDFNTTYWQNTAGDVTGRSCAFNDEYTFTLTGKVLTFDSKGDFYVDEEGGAPWPAGMPSAGCYANSAIPVQYQAWANNATFSFDVINNNKLKVVGNGAHLGLYKAGDPPNAAVNTPQASVTYDIVSITPTRIVLKLDYGWGAWKFIYVPA